MKIYKLKLAKNSFFFENRKNAPKSGISRGVSVPKMEKFFTTFFALLALRLLSDILTTFTIRNTLTNADFAGVFFVTFNHPRSFNLFGYTIIFSIILFVQFDRVCADFCGNYVRLTPVPEWPQPPLISERSEAG